MKIKYIGGIKFIVEAESLARCRPRTVKRLALAIAQVLKETRVKKG